MPSTSCTVQYSTCVRQYRSSQKLIAYMLSSSSTVHVHVSHLSSQTLIQYRALGTLASHEVWDWASVDLPWGRRPAALAKTLRKICAGPCQRTWYSSINDLTFCYRILTKHVHHSCTCAVQYVSVRFAEAALHETLTACCTCYTFPVQCVYSTLALKSW